MDAPAIRIVGLSKRYGGLLAVDNLDLEVSNGEVFGFLGLNGAGKTTTIRVLLDLIRPSAGRAFALGEDCQSNGLRVRAQVGYLPGEIRFYGDMTGTETLDLLARLGRQSVAPHYRGQLLERMELSSADLRRRIREYSNFSSGKWIAFLPGSRTDTKSLKSSLNVGPFELGAPSGLSSTLSPDFRCATWRSRSRASRTFS